MNSPNCGHKSLESDLENLVLNCCESGSGVNVELCFIWTDGDAFQRNSDSKGRDGNGSKA